MICYGSSQYPVSNDWSLDIKHIVYFFSPKYKSFQVRNVSNKYLFSYINDFFCIQRVRSKYRVIGRILSDFDFFSICPDFVRGIDFDVFITSDFDSCRCVFNRLLHDYCCR